MVLNSFYNLKPCYIKIILYVINIHITEILQLYYGYNDKILPITM